MNKLTKSVTIVSQVFGLLAGSNFTTATEKVMAEYPCTRYMY